MSADPARPLVSAFDGLLLDLDGVVYVGPRAVPHAADAIRQAREAGAACGFVTNNASRSASRVVEHLARIGVPSDVHDVITSPQAAVAVLPRFVPPGSRVLVVGGQGIDEALVDGGFQPVHALAEHPVAVMQGFSPDVNWRDLAEATYAVRAGLPWISTNPDLTFPTDRGVAPGNGAMVQLVAQAAGRGPDAVAGKPEPPLLEAAIARLGSRRPLMIGDRLDTDIAAGARIGIPSLLVFTGVTTVPELVSAIAPERPTYLGADLRTLLVAYPEVVVDHDSATCRSARAWVDAGTLQVRPGAEAWDAVRAVAALAWRIADAGDRVDAQPALAALAAALG